jgi:hypothetical protein
MLEPLFVQFANNNSQECPGLRGVVIFEQISGSHFAIFLLAPYVLSYFLLPRRTRKTMAKVFYVYVRFPSAPIL